jgi:arsenate reductase
MSSLKIYHNPRCSKSRQTLALIQERDVNVEIIEYLKNPPSKKELSQILKLLDISAKDLLRKGEAEYKESGLNNDGLTDAKMVELMVQYPKVIERPIVVSDKAAVVGRPPENVLTLL